MIYNVNIAIPIPLNKLYSYIIESNKSIDDLIGCRALVSFGRRSLTGIIIEESKTSDRTVKMKTISELIDDSPSFSPELLKLAKWIAEYYVCSLGLVLKAALPSGMSPKTFVKISLTKELSDEELYNLTGNSIKRQLLLNYLRQNDAPVSLAYLQKKLKISSISDYLDMLSQRGLIKIETALTKRSKERKQKGIKLTGDLLNNQAKLKSLLDEYDKTNPKYSLLLSYVFLNQEKGIIPKLSVTIKEFNISSSIPKTLEKKGFIEFVDIEIDRTLSNESRLSKSDESKLNLTDEQSDGLNFVKNSIDSKSKKPILIHGITGSGKTLIYIHAIKHILQKKKNALLLVPEISLTPQLIDRFRNVFGDSVAALHSRMSDGERFDAWRLIRSGEKRIIIGARSAVFAPVQNLGLIIVDEEHDSSYKQDNPEPRYNGRDCAIMRAKIENIPIILGSATPSLESMHNVLTDKYSLISIKERADNAKLPDIMIIDRTMAFKSGQMLGSFSKQLIGEIEERLEKKEGIILFQNRRGYASFLECHDCGYVPMCKNCDVSLTLHKTKNQLRCHYCGYTISSYKSCPACGYPELKELGTGTQRIEDELASFLNDDGFEAVIQRVDLDTTSKKGTLRKIFTSFISGEIDILVGTQMVAKGLDFERVTLVGVINADMQMFLPDFRATERTFQLLTQVSGRSGRSSSKSGKVIIQTSHPNHPAIKAVLNSSYDLFFKKEILNRKNLDYPPFVRLISIEVIGKDQHKVEDTAFLFYRLIPNHNSFKKIGPSLPFIPKLINNYRRLIIIKSDKRKDPSGNIFRNALFSALNEYSKKYSSESIKIRVDVDAYHVF